MHRILALLALAALPAAAQTVDYAKSEISFVSKQMNVPVEGRFDSFAAQIRFDPKKPSEGQAQIEVDLASVSTGSADADTEVKKKAWFNLAAFPTAKFVSTEVRSVGPGRFEAQGKLTIKGVTRDVVAPFTVKTAGASTVFEGVFPLMRLQFNVGEGAWSDTETVADEVQVRFRIVQSGKAK
ncbi:MAG TPA: YceI family protein [Burkholderiales bacterium]|nr:YceI family protein [Burkholderiales bacterium]